MIARIGLLTAGNKNTGKSKYGIMPDIIKAWLLVPKGWSYTFTAASTDATLAAGIQANLLALGVNNAYGSRSQFIGPFETFTDKTTDPTYQTFGLGRMVMTDQGKYIFDYDYIDGGIEYHQKIMSFLGKTDLYNLVGIGHMGNVYATNLYDPTTGLVTGCKGLTPAQIDPAKWKLANKDKAADFRVVLGLQYVDEFNKDLCILATGAEMIPLLKDNTVQDVLLSSTGVGVAGVYTVTVTLDDMRINLAAGDAAIGLTAACFSVKRQSTGGGITITGIAVVGQNVSITCDTTSTNYLLHAPVVISLANVAAVFGVTAGYYESQTGGVVMVD